jgi:hypothetical protein
MRLFLLLFIAATMLPACASSYASKCVEWMPKSSHYELKIGGVDRVDIWRCTSFSEVP